MTAGEAVPPLHVVVMGVSGCGKSTVAEALARRLGRPWADADDFHSAANVAAMSAGRPLTDLDRAPWLAALRDWLTARARDGTSAVMACSALRRRYRDVLRDAEGDVVFVHLAGTATRLGERVAARRGHFMPATLLASQFAALEPLAPDEVGATIAADEPLDDLLDEAVAFVSALRPG